MKSAKFKVQSSKLACSLVLPVLLFCTATSHAAAWQWIDGQRVLNKMKEGGGLWIIDVRNAVSYDAVHIEGSVNIPADALAHKKFPAHKALVLVDDSLGQQTAQQAADALVKKGQERVFVLEGGIPAWKIEGLLLVESKTFIRGVTVQELKWALAHDVPLKVYDLRDEKDRKLGTVQNSETVPGKTMTERLDAMKGILAGGLKKTDLAARMKKPQPVLLVFSASDDAEGYTRKIMQGAAGDVRYLIGGYEATVSDKLRKQQTTGSCPTCPGNKKSGS